MNDIDVIMSKIFTQDLADNLESKTRAYNALKELVSCSIHLRFDETNRSHNACCKQVIKSSGILSSEAKVRSGGNKNVTEYLAAELPAIYKSCIQEYTMAPKECPFTIDQLYEAMFEPWQLVLLYDTPWDNLKEGCYMQNFPFLCKYLYSNRLRSEILGKSCAACPHGPNACIMKMCTDERFISFAKEEK